MVLQGAEKYAAGHVQRVATNMQDRAEPGMTRDELRQVEISVTEDGQDLLLIRPDGAGHFITATHPVPAELRQPDPEVESAVETFKRALGDPAELVRSLE